MNEIIIIEKPEWVSFDDIHRVLYAAHESNREKGFSVNTASMSGERLKKHLGDTGKCFIALDGEKIIGTCSYRFLKRDAWYVKGEVGDIILLGVLPEYKNRGISGKLRRKVREEMLASGCKYIEARTSAENMIVQNISLKKGYKYVDYISTGTDHYTVVMMKWLDHCPFSDRYISLRYHLKKLYVHLRYKPGGKKRF